MDKLTRWFERWQCRMQIFVAVILVCAALQWSPLTWAPCVLQDSELWVFIPLCWTDELMNWIDNHSTYKANIQINFVFSLLDAILYWYLNFRLLQKSGRTYNVLEIWQIVDCYTFHYHLNEGVGGKNVVHLWDWSYIGDGLKMGSSNTLLERSTHPTLELWPNQPQATCSLDGHTSLLLHHCETVAISPGKQSLATVSATYTFLTS